MSFEEESTDDVAELRLSSYKTSLNLMRGRRFNLEIEDDVEACSEGFSSEDISLPKIWQQVEALQSFIGHLMNIKKAVARLKTNKMVASFQDASRLNGEVRSSVIEITELCSVLLPYQKNDDREYFELKLMYSKALIQYREEIAKKRAIVTDLQKQLNMDVQRKIEKTKDVIKRINTTRIITMLLMAAFVSDHEAFPEINSFRTSMRRDLVIEDFKDTWDVGLELQD